MNKYEQVLFEKELKKIIFSYPKINNNKTTKSCLKTNYEELAIQLKLLKQLKEKELQEGKIYVSTKPIYTDEDITFLKQTIKNGELTIADLTFYEAIMVGFTGAEYRRVQRKVASKIDLSKKKQEEFDYKFSNMNSPTPNISNTLYKQLQKKK